MKLHILYCALLGLFLLGCKKDFKSSTATYIHNSSSVAIELYPYQAGALVRENILMILPNEKREIYRDNP